MLQMRNPFGLQLQNSIMPGDQPQYPMPMPQVPAPAADAPKPQSKLGAFLAKIGQLGEFIGATQGDPMAMRSILNRQQVEQENVQWSRRRQAENDDWMQRQQWQRAHPEPSAMDRNLQTWQQWTPDQRTAYGDMQHAMQPDPDVVVPLPNGQIYAGPRSGLSQALTGQVPGLPTKPVGPLTPIPGGGVGNGTGGFRP